MEKCSSIPSRYIEKFLLEFRHRSGLPLINEISIFYVSALLRVEISNDLSLDYTINKFVNAALIVAHEAYHTTRRFKSYDW